MHDLSKIVEPFDPWVTHDRWPTVIFAATILSVCLPGPIQDLDLEGQVEN